VITLPQHIIDLNPEYQALLAKPIKVKERSKLSNPGGFDSPLEADWDAELTARGLAHLAHPFTFHLPGGVDYTPDQIAWPSRTDDNHQVWIGQATVYEVKGEYVKNTRDSRTRFRIAAGLHPYLRFAWVTRSRGGTWREKVYRP